MMPKYTKQTEFSIVKSWFFPYPYIYSMFFVLIMYYEWYTSSLWRPTFYSNYQLYVCNFYRFCYIKANIVAYKMVNFSENAFLIMQKLYILKIFKLVWYFKYEALSSVSISQSVPY